jgi:hypothetical protein
MGKHTLEKLPKWARELHHAAKIRAAARNIPFTLTADEYSTLVESCAGRCQLSGLPFEFDKQGHRVKRPFAPSLDRIDHKGGYVHGNVRLVCVAANVAMNVWGEAALRRLAEAMCGYSNTPGVWSPSRGKLGAVARRLKGGRFTYQARLRIDGKQRTFGSFPTRAMAEEKSSQVRTALAAGLPVDGFHLPPGRKRIATPGLHTVSEVET